MGTRISNTSLLFSTKKRNFWEQGRGQVGWVRGKSSSAPPSPPGWGDWDAVPVLGLYGLDLIHRPFPCLSMSTAHSLGPEGAAHLVEVTELPEENQQLLVELDLLSGVGQVGLEQGVGQ
jgi:hypothetical protein